MLLMDVVRQLSGACLAVIPVPQPAASHMFAGEDTERAEPPRAQLSAWLEGLLKFPSPSTPCAINIKASAGRA